MTFRPGKAFYSFSCCLWHFFSLLCSFLSLNATIPATAPAAFQLPIRPFCTLQEVQLKFTLHYGQRYCLGVSSKSRRQINNACAFHTRLVSCCSMRRASGAVWPQRTKHKSLPGTAGSSLLTKEVPAAEEQYQQFSQLHATRGQRLLNPGDCLPARSPLPFIIPQQRSRPSLPGQHPTFHSL